MIINARPIEGLNQTQGVSVPIDLRGLTRLISQHLASDRIHPYDTDIV